MTAREALILFKWTLDVPPQATLSENIYLNEPGTLVSAAGSAV
jgi:hypothetical protein